jgi:hypothetical protein
MDTTELVACHDQFRIDAGVTGAMEKLRAECRAVDLPVAKAFAASLRKQCRQEIKSKRQLTPGTGAGASAGTGAGAVTHVVLRVTLCGITPRIWREVKVTTQMQLAEFHDQVLCPVFGYQRCYHAYAFQRGPQEPWLGDSQSTALDMAHVPLYIRALGDDAGVTLAALFRSEGDHATYVHDLGDWWEHSITCVGVVREGDGKAAAASSSALSSSPPPPPPPSCVSGAAELLGGALAGVPLDSGGLGRFVTNVNILAGNVPVDDPTNPNPHQRSRVLSPSSPEWWRSVKDDFRKKNCASVVYDPMWFDLAGARANLAMSLVSNKTSMARASQSFMRREETGFADMSANGFDYSTSSKQPARACATCGSSAGLAACGGCRQEWYCCKDHQIAHWKEHKRDCKKHSITSKNKNRKQRAK